MNRRRRTAQPSRPEELPLAGACRLMSSVRDGPSGYWQSPASRKPTPQEAADQNLPPWTAKETRPPSRTSGQARTSGPQYRKHTPAPRPLGYKPVLTHPLFRGRDKTSRFLQTHDLAAIKPKARLQELFEEHTELTLEEIQNFWRYFENDNLLFYKMGEEIASNYKEIIEEIVGKIFSNGFLCGEKITGIKVKINELNITELTEENSYTELSTLLYEAIKKGLNQAELILLEPIYHTIIQLPPDYVKNALSLASKYSAKIKNVNQEKDYQTIIEILIPVRNSIKFAEDIRSSTSGKAFWQNEFHSFMEVPSQEAKKIISDLRFSKGLSW